MLSEINPIKKDKHCMTSQVKLKKTKLKEEWNAMYVLLHLKWITNKIYHTVHGTLLNITWQPGWKGSLGENGYINIDGCIPLLFI